MSTSPNASVNRHSDNLSNWSHISCNLLESWIMDPESDSKKLIIIDSRPATDYNNLHIKNALSIAYSRIMKRRLQTDKISINELLIKNTNNNLIDNQYSTVVVYDNNSEHTNQLDSDSFAYIILTKLVQKFKSVSFLSGGFVSFHSKFSNLCEPSARSNYINFPQIPSFINLSSSSSTTSSTSNSLTSTPVVSEKLIGAISSAPPIGYYLVARAESEKDTATAELRKINSHNEFIKQNNIIMTSNTTVNNENNIQSDSTQDLVIREPTKILDFLYLGSQEDALSKLTMNALNITCVLNVSQTCPKPTFISDAHFLRIPVNDGHSAQIMPFFDVAFRFIEKCRKANTKVIIHCLAGISRSPTLAIAYLMRYMNMKSDDAYKFVKERRSTISPNFNFLGQLYDYERQLRSENIIKDSSTMKEKSSDSLMKLDQQQQKQLLLSQPSSTDVSDKTNLDQMMPKFVNQKFPRRKTYIFKFNDVHDTNLESDAKPVNNPVVNLRSSTAADTLQSPSTALATFDLNSPTSNTNGKATDASFTLQASHDIVMMKPFPKSFTIDSSIIDLKNSSCLKRDSSSEKPKTGIIEKSLNSDSQNNNELKKENLLLQIRRPTNFLINSTSLSKLNTPNLSSAKETPMEGLTNNDQGSDQMPPVFFRVKSFVDSSVESNNNNNDSEMKATNRLKRPSSFLLGINNESSMNAFSNSFEINYKRSSVPTTTDCSKLKSEELSYSDFCKSKASTNQKLPCVFQHQQLQQQHACAANQIPTPMMKPKNMILERTFSCTSGDSSASSCSCCSNISSSSSTFSIGTISHSCNTALSTTIPTQQQQLQQQQQQLQVKMNQENSFNQKKIKLSPLNDKCSMSSFFNSSAPFSHLLKSINEPTTASSSTASSSSTTTTATNENSSQLNIDDELFESCFDVESSHKTDSSHFVDKSSSSSNPNQQSKNLSTSILFNETSLSNSRQNEFYFLQNNLTDESVTTPIHINPSLTNILNSFSDRLSESKSFEALKNLIDNPSSRSTQSSIINSITASAVATAGGNTNNESDENSDAANSECDEATKESNKKRKKTTSIRNMLVSMPSTNTNKSSSSSSKNGSNKNSLNGSIETMISVL